MINENSSVGDIVAATAGIAAASLHQNDPVIVNALQVTFTSAPHVQVAFRRASAATEPPVQRQHDCCTPVNHMKFMAAGLQFVDADLDENHAVATAMKQIEGGTDEICAGPVEGRYGQSHQALYVELSTLQPCRWINT